MGQEHQTQRKRILSPAELTKLFAASAADEGLDLAARKLASRMAILAIHVDLLQGRLVKLGEVTDKSISSLADALAALQKGGGGADPEPTESTSSPTQEHGEETDEESIVKKLQEEVARDMADTQGPQEKTAKKTKGGVKQRHQNGAAS